MGVLDGTAKEKSGGTMVLYAKEQHKSTVLQLMFVREFMGQNLRQGQQGKQASHASLPLSRLGLHQPHNQRL